VSESGRVCVRERERERERERGQRGHVGDASRPRKRERGNTLQTVHKPGAPSTKKWRQPAHMHMEFWSLEEKRIKKQGERAEKNMDKKNKHHFADTIFT
jgi:hypothetical protein